VIKVIIKSIIICSECRGGEKCPAAGEGIREVGESVSVISERDFLEAAGSRVFGVGPRVPLP
jgi:hypothetical protein